ncbi:tRNA lysidine(34) synthetase TilS [Lacticaseibacillus absianus]|uniref:tRNA lysidine(34) synthetase TilS n=1 Tax=Lacticaseibacillus absianus TaxID=2729623 RepID=UPI0015CB1311|nr:tRNA lysidine(34) synthetase TilS [Lacticaseibacillus absianus]
MLDGETLMAPFQLEAGTSVVLAVSGGVDSMVLLHLLAPMHPRRLQLTVAQFDHQLRPSSAAEQQLVVAQARALGVPVVTGTWPRSAHPVSGLEAAARAARYAFLTATAAAVHAPVIALAHHADDQLETLLFRLARSGSVRAMQGIRPTRPAGAVTLIRPLLQVSKATLRAYADAHRLAVAEDESNDDLAFSRNRLRHTVVPALKRENPQVLAHTTRLTTELTGLIALADQRGAQLLQDALVRPGVLDWTTLMRQPEPVQAALLAQQLANWQVFLPPATQAACLHALQVGSGRRAFGPSLVTVTHRLELRPTEAVAGPTQPPQPLVLGQWVTLPAGRVGLFDAVPADVDEWALVPAGPIVIRQRQVGDRLRLPNGHHQLLRRFLINAKVPVAQRAQRLVAAYEDTVVWVQGKERPELFQFPRTDIIQAVLAFQTTNQGDDTRL